MRNAGRPHDRRSTLGFAGLSVAVVLFASCALGTQLLHAPTTTHGPTAVPGGMSQDAATTKALHLAPASNATPTVVWAAIENDPFVPRGSNPPGRLVWIVRLTARLGASPCPSGFLDRTPTASDPACLDGEDGINVVLDYFTGDFVGWAH